MVVSYWAPPSASNSDFHSPRIHIKSKKERMSSSQQHTDSIRVWFSSVGPGTDLILETPEELCKMQDLLFNSTLLILWNFVIRAHSIVLRLKLSKEFSPEKVQEFTIDIFFCFRYNYNYRKGRHSSQRCVHRYEDEDENVFQFSFFFLSNSLMLNCP